MQEIFPCPACGARNYIGQAFCQACGQKFQYNCPHCGTVVDATLVNCPRCRESLYWPKPQKIKPFPKQPAAYQGGEESGEETKAKPKSDPWLTGCLGLVIIAILAMVAYFVYDNYIKKPSTPPPGEMGFNQMHFPEFESLQGANIIVCQRNEIQKRL